MKIRIVIRAIAEINPEHYGLKKNATVNQVITAVEKECGDSDAVLSHLETNGFAVEVQEVKPGE
jgi:hypothetical protein